MTNPSRVLIVNDQRLASSRATVVLGADPSSEVRIVCPPEVREIARAFSPDVVVVDATSLDLVADIRCERPKVPVLVVTSNASVEQAIKAIRVDANDYLETFTDIELRGHVARLTASFRGDEIAERPGFALH